MSNQRNTTRAPATAVRSSPSKSAGPRRASTFDFIYLPNETGASRRISLPKVVVYGFFVGLFCLVGAVGGLGYYVKTTRTLSADFDRLQAENHSIRSEAAALVAKLQEVQNNLSRVDQFSDKVRAEASQLEPGTLKGSSKKITNGLSLAGPRKARGGRGEAGGKETDTKKAEPGKKQGTLDALPANIGPLSREEFEYVRRKGVVASAPGAEMRHAVGASLKVDSLEFKSLFETLDDIRSKSGAQAASLGAILKELQGYRAKLASTPTIAPVTGYVSSMYGVRVSPITGQNRMHQGLDIAAPLGSPIRAAAGGKVVRTGFADDYGRFVEVSHGFGVLSRYAHAQSIAVKVGDVVTKGDNIGAVGNTGRTTGPHLHYEIEIGGRKVDPSGFIVNF